MERHARIVLVISFVVFTSATLVAFSRWILPPDPDARSTRQDVLFQGSVSGLSIGSDVRYLGVLVGQVSDINLSKDYPGHVDVEFSTDEVLPPAEDLLAMLEPLGITGLSVVELQERTAEDPGFPVPPGTIPGYPSVFARLTGSAGRVTSSLENTLSRLNQALSDEVLDDLSATLRESRQLATNLSRATNDVDQLVNSATRTAGALEDALPEMREVVQQLQNEVFPTFSAAGEAMRRAADGVDATLAANSKNVERLLSRDIPSLTGTTDELAVALQRLSALLASVSDEPGALLYGKQVREVEIDRE